MTSLFITAMLLAAPNYDMSGAQKADPRLAVPTEREVLLVELSSQSCAACRAMRPVLNAMIRDGCRVSIIDVDNQKYRPFVDRFRQQFTRTGLPFWILAIDGVAWETRRGMQSYNTMRHWYWQAEAARANRDGLAVPVRPVAMDLRPVKVTPSYTFRPRTTRINQAARGR